MLSPESALMVSSRKNSVRADLLSRYALLEGVSLIDLSLTGKTSNGHRDGGSTPVGPPSATNATQRGASEPVARSGSRAWTP